MPDTELYASVLLVTSTSAALLSRYIPFMADVDEVVPAEAVVLVLFTQMLFMIFLPV